MKIYENDRGFQLGNLLYLLLQAHRDRLRGIEESYVLRAGHYRFAQTFFPKTQRLFKKAMGHTLEPFGYFQISGEDFSSEELDDFCKTYLMESVEEKSRIIEKKDITIAIRRTDFMSEENRLYYGYDANKYVLECLEEIQDIHGDDFKQMTIRITSDDPIWCQEELVPKLHEELGILSLITVEQQDIQENFLQLYACNHYFICPNSTYGYWVGYCLRIGKPSVQVFVPDFNTTLMEDGKQIADIRGWKVISVDRSEFQ